MTDLPLRIATLRYDHMQALLDGTARIDGVDATFQTDRFVTEIFEDMVANRAYDVSELGLTFYLRTLELDDPPFVAIPVFLNRHFRHSAIYVNTSSGIKRPEDLRGKTIGELAVYGHDAGVWPKGILSDEYGVTPDQSRWVIGGADFPMKPFDWLPSGAAPPGVDITPAPEGRGLAPMLEAGEIDALISAIVPQAYLNGSPHIAQLFPDVEAVERDYYRRTKIYPIMHTVVMQRELLRQHPGLARAVYHGFADSTQAMQQHYRRAWTGQHTELSVPWFTDLYERNRTLLSDDYWANGIHANRTTVDTYLRYFYEQGLSTRRWTCDEIFAAELLDT